MATDEEIVTNSLPCELIFNADEFARMQLGFNESGRNQDERWRLIFLDSTLKIIRAGSDFICYSIEFVERDGYFISSRAKIFLEPVANGNYHRPIILYLIRHYLLGEDNAFLLESLFGVGLKVDSGSIHGIGHWQRVAIIGAYLVEHNGADKELVRLFAYLHDLGRSSDTESIGHGALSAELVEKNFTHQALKISKQQYQKLLTAIAGHDLVAAVSDDVDVQSCWDADRLDLWRVGIIPDPERLYTAIAKHEATINWSRRFIF